MVGYNKKENRIKEKKISEDKVHMLIQSQERVSVALILSPISDEHSFRREWNIAFHEVFVNEKRRPYEQKLCFLDLS